MSLNEFESENESVPINLDILLTLEMCKRKGIKIKTYDEYFGKFTFELDDSENNKIFNSVNNIDVSSPLWCILTVDTKLFPAGKKTIEIFRNKNKKIKYEIALENFIKKNFIETDNYIPFRCKYSSDEILQYFDAGVSLMVLFGLINKNKDISSFYELSDNEIQELETETFLSLIESPNIISDIYEFVKYDSDDILNSCFICSKPIANLTSAISCCDNEVCQFTLREFSFGQNIKLWVSMNKELFNFLLKSFWASLVSWKKDLDSFPKSISYKCVCNIMENRNDIRRVIDSCCDDIEIKEAVNKINPLAYEFISWFIDINTKLVFIPDSNYFTPAETSEKKHNITFMVEETDFEKKLKFDELKKELGTRVVYHCSPLFNWYKIINQGFRIFTKESGRQLNGALYGPGIYFNEALKNVIPYAKGRTVIVMICEVINFPDFDKKEHIVVDKPGCIKPLFLIDNLIYEKEFEPEVILRCYEELNKKN